MDILHPAAGRGMLRAALLAAAHGLAMAMARRRRARQLGRELRRQLRALDGLDARTLADLGLHRMELGSVAAELSGAAEPTRRRVRSVAPLY